MRKNRKEKDQQGRNSSAFPHNTYMYPDIRNTAALNHSDTSRCLHREARTQSQCVGAVINALMLIERSACEMTLCQEGLEDGLSQSMIRVCLNKTS